MKSWPALISFPRNTSTSAGSPCARMIVMPRGAVDVVMQRRWLVVAQRVLSCPCSSTELLGDTGHTGSHLTTTPIPATTPRLPPTSPPSTAGLDDACGSPAGFYHVTTHQGTSTAEWPTEARADMARKARPDRVQLLSERRGMQWCIPTHG